MLFTTKCLAVWLKDTQLRKNTHTYTHSAMLILSFPSPGLQFSRSHCEWVEWFFVCCQTNKHVSFSMGDCTHCVLAAVPFYVLQEPCGGQIKMPLMPFQPCGLAAPPLHCMMAAFHEWWCWNGTVFPALWLGAGDVRSALPWQRGNECLLGDTVGLQHCRPHNSYWHFNRLSENVVSAALLNMLLSN